jgi:hypothetical protein
MAGLEVASWAYGHHSPQTLLQEPLHQLLTLVQACLASTGR